MTGGVDMNDGEIDRLLEQSLSGDPPSPAFRDQVLRGSSTLFALTRRRRARWRLTALTAAAAVLIAGVSFLGGRYSVMRRSTGAPPGTPPVAAMVPRANGTVVVPGELVAWVNAARLFKQLGMEDRVGRALDRAGKLMPPDAAGSGVGSVFTGAGQEERADKADLEDRREAFSVMNRIMAQYSGD
jgi:hypothetical protein